MWRKFWQRHTTVNRGQSFQYASNVEDSLFDADYSYLSPNHKKIERLVKGGIKMGGTKSGIILLGSFSGTGTYTF